MDTCIGIYIDMCIDMCAEMGADLEPMWVVLHRIGEMQQASGLRCALLGTNLCNACTTTPCLRICLELCLRQVYAHVDTHAYAQVHLHLYALLCALSTHIYAYDYRILLLCPEQRGNICWTVQLNARWNV